MRRRRRIWTALKTAADSTRRDETAAARGPRHRWAGPARSRSRSESEGDRRQVAVTPGRREPRTCLGDRRPSDEGDLDDNDVERDHPHDARPHWNASVAVFVLDD